jgi:predicted GNAT family acetyltransferase
VKLTCVTDPDPRTFATRALDWLYRDPVRNNVICTVLDARLDGTRELEPGSRWLRVVDEAGELRGVAIQTPPRGPLLSPMPAVAAAVLADALAEGTALPAVDGPAAETRAFADRYARLTGVAVEPGLGMRLYRLDAVEQPDGVPGRFRAVVPSDRELIVSWVDEFSREATPDHPRIDAASQVDDRLRRGGLMWLWEDGGQPVSFLWLSVPVAGAVRISAVYTPPDHRGRGYASACVAAASAHALATGATACVLYTDLANPTSNKIYQRVGYRPVADAQEYRFR